MANYCYKCGNKLEVGAKYCTNCGTKTTETASSESIKKETISIVTQEQPQKNTNQDYCYECGSTLEAGTKFCTNCGTKTIKVASIKSIKQESTPIATQAEPQKIINEKPHKIDKKSKHVTVVAVLFIVLFVVAATFAVYFLYQYTGAEGALTDETSSYDSLTSNYNNLQNSYQSLDSNYNSLQSSYQSLESNYNSLQSSYNSLDSTYTSYKRTIEVRYGQGADCEQFITPNNPYVIYATSAALGHSADGDVSWDDMIAINNYVGSNIKYNYDTFDGSVEDCWFYPSETLSQGYGDCEDHALLMVSMCKAEGSAPWLYCALIQLQDGRGHLCVFVKCQGGYLYIFDPTSQPEYFFGILLRNAWNSGTSKLISDALQQYSNECWNGETITVLKIFNENTYQTFNNNQEFTNFWTG